MNDHIDKPAAPRVLIVSARVGAGHVQAARAVLESLQAAAPQIVVEHVDILDFSPRLCRAYYSGGYALAVSKSPRLYGLSYRLTDMPDRSDGTFSQRMRIWGERRWLGRFAGFLGEWKPDLVVHTHFLASPLIAHLMRRGILRTRQMVVVTDIEIHRWWYAEQVDRFFTASQVSAARLMRWDVSEERITVSGIPVLSKWTAPLDRRAVLADWELPADKKIVIVAGGADFTCGAVEKIARGIVEACEDCFAVVLAGNNKKLLARLKSMSQTCNRIRPVAFTDRGHELVGVCSLMVTKAGGITTAECLATATPMVLLRPVPGQESSNAQYLADRWAAVVTRNVEDVVWQVKKLLGAPDVLSAMARAAKSLYKPAGRTIVESIIDAISSTPTKKP